MKKLMLRVIAPVFAVLVAVLAFVACEEGPDTGELSSYWDEHPAAAWSDTWLTIKPSSTTLSEDGDRVSLTVSGGVPPYSWSLQREILGVIIGSGDTITYERSRPGDNIVRVQDAAGNWAYCVVAQPDEANTLAVSPSSKTLSNNGDQFTLTASGGEEPYSWDVYSDALGSLVGSTTNKTTVYQRDAVGNNVVILSDVDGREAYCLVSQPAVSPPVISPASLTLTNTVLTYVFTVSGGTPSYTWGIFSGDGTISGSGEQAVYTRNLADNDAVIQVVDANAQIGYAVITIEP